MQGRAPSRAAAVILVHFLDTENVFGMAEGDSAQTSWTSPSEPSAQTHHIDVTAVTST